MAPVRKDGGFFAFRGTLPASAAGGQNRETIRNLSLVPRLGGAVVFPAVSGPDFWEMEGFSCGMGDGGDFLKAKLEIVTIQ